MQYEENKELKDKVKVTILILLETPLQYQSSDCNGYLIISHNPYFTGNSYAILKKVYKETKQEGHNPYFTGNSFAIIFLLCSLFAIFSHNPYFTGNSFAIGLEKLCQGKGLESQSLFYWKLLCNYI